MALSRRAPVRPERGRVQEPVTLHVYDLTEQIKGANKIMKVVGTGVYHGAVEVYGCEWSFGYTEEGTGVFPCDPKENPCFSFKQSVPMGHTEMLESQVLALIEELMEEWQGAGYHLLQRNCCDFSNELCKRLGVGAVPGWVKSAAGVGARIDDVVHLKPLFAVVDRGRQKRTRGGASSSEEERQGGLKELTQGVADFGRGVTEIVGSTASGVLAQGRMARGSSSDGGYQFGDFSRGMLAGAAKGVHNVLAQGKAARDAGEGDGYKFGDLTRGILSSVAKR